MKRKLLLSPNRANPMVSLPPITSNQLRANLKKVGLTAEDLAPIDWRKKANLSPIRNQGYCGDCWAQASTSVLNDRFIIKKDLKGLILSSVLTTRCAPSGNPNSTPQNPLPPAINYGCGGGSPDLAGLFFENQLSNEDRTEILGRGFLPKSPASGAYSIDELTGSSKGCNVAQQIDITGITDENGSNLPTCSDMVGCVSQTDNTVYRAKVGSTKTLYVIKDDGSVDPDNTINHMKTSLLDGPIAAVFCVPLEFQLGGYNINGKTIWEIVTGSDIYIRDTSNRYEGEYTKILNRINNNNTFVEGQKSSQSIQHLSDIAEGGNAWHAISIVGWDIGKVDGKDVPYWIVRNSWGQDWGENGYCKFAMYPYNNTLYLDVPSVSGNNINGSGTSFDPDINSGHESGTVFHTNIEDDSDIDPSKNKEHNIKRMIIIGIIIAVILLLLLLIFSGNKKNTKMSFF